MFKYHWFNSSPIRLSCVCQLFTNRMFGSSTISLIQHSGIRYGLMFSTGAVPKGLNTKNTRYNINMIYFTQFLSVQGITHTVKYIM